MRGRIWQAGRRVLGAVALSGLAATAFAARIDTLRVSQNQDGLRAVFELSDPIEYKLFEIGNPDRIVIDVQGSDFAPGFDAPEGKGMLKGVRTGHQGKGNVRIVFDLDARVRPKSFLLPAQGRTPPRLVVDLAPRGEQDDVVKTARAAAKKTRDVIVAIDAGHGGADPGATGAAGTREKDITLAVARELAHLVDRQTGMHAVLTRDDDVFIPLKERYQKAREAKADLFVSVHADAFASGDARGSSVWILSSRGATSEAARWLADRENRADLVGGVSLDDKDNTLAAVLLDLSQGATLTASSAVADQVLRALAHIGPTHRGYVEKANFVVLRSPDVPSILVETAFITNPTEEKRLNSPAQRAKLATAILDGVKDYFVAAPPPGTWFAANAQREHERSARLAARKGASDEVAVIRDDDPDRDVLVRAPGS